MLAVGAAAVLRLIAAFPKFVASIFSYVGDLAELAGNPEISTTWAIVVVAFLASGYYLRGAIAFLAFCVFDAVGKDFLLDFGAFEGGLGVEQ